MVIQSEIIEKIILPAMVSESWTMKFGESATVSYTDNALTTTHVTDSSPTISSSNNELVITGGMTSSEGNGNNMSALLISTSAGAGNKCLFTQFAKTNTIQVEATVRQGFYVQ